MYLNSGLHYESMGIGGLSRLSKELNIMKFKLQFPDEFSTFTLKFYSSFIFCFTSLMAAFIGLLKAIRDLHI